MKKLLSLLTVVILLAGCTAPQTVQQPDGTVSTNYVADPKLIAGIEVAKAVNTSTAPVNPFAGLIEVGLSAVAVGAGWFAKRKNDKAAASELLLKTIVQAIDSLDDANVKTTIQAHASRIGVEGELDTVVKKVGSGSI